MLVLLAAMACQVEPEPAAEFRDPARDLQAASLAPAIAATAIDPLIEGIVFGAVDPSEITVTFGEPEDEDALAELEQTLEPEEEIDLHTRWEDDQPAPERKAQKKIKAPPAASSKSVGSVQAKDGPQIHVEGVEIKAEAKKPLSVSQVVRKQRGKVQYCHETGKTRDSQVHGRITVAWTIADGKATDIQILDNTTGDDLMATCVARQVRTMRFPKEMAEEVNYPFVFQQG